uniref:Uncharacterized protein n=1 Tax=Rhizophora mucronata TaxID=61149 RepID=A0A2P2J0J9_RHIMU
MIPRWQIDAWSQFYEKKIDHGNLSRRPK